MSTWTLPIHMIPPAWRPEKIKDKSGNVRLFKDVLKEDPNYEIYTDVNGKPITPDEVGTTETKVSKSKNTVDVKKKSPGELYSHNETESMKDPANPYNAAKTLLGLQASIAGGAVGMATAPIATTVGFGGDFLGQMTGTVASNYLFDNPDKPFNLNVDTLLTPREALQTGTGLVLGGMMGADAEFMAPMYLRDYKAYKVAKALNNSAKEFDGTVGPEYFHSPDNWYRITESPEVHGIREQGKNVTTTDLGRIPSQANDFRMLVLNNRLKAGTGENEGYWIYPGPLKPSSGRFNFDDIRLARKTGSAHGNRSLGSWGEMWDGGTANSGEFPGYILEGRALPDGTIPYGINRRTFRSISTENLEPGSRIGFSTGLMPMEGLRAFRRLPNGRFVYEGEVLPNKTTSIPSTTPVKGKHVFNTTKSNLSESEYLGLPKSVRNRKPRFDSIRDLGEIKYNPETWESESALGKYIGEGDESIAFENNGRVFKVMHNPGASTGKEFVKFDLNDALNFYNTYILPRNRHNLFEPIKFEGISRDSRGIVLPVISLRKLTPAITGYDLEAAKLIEKQIDDILLKNGYTLKLTPHHTPGYFNNNGFIYDIHPWNVGTNKSGEFRIFDMLTD